jgi:nucleotide-binding universal stress UspA family protein
MDRIVLGVDSSPGSAAAVRWCAAHAAGSEVVVVHAVAPLVTLVPPPGPAPVGPRDPEDRAALATQLRELCGPLDEAGVPWRSRIVDSPAALGLEEVAVDEDAEMIVVGRRGHGQSLSHLIGSVPRRLAQHAPRPVLIVPEEIR